MILTVDIGNTNTNFCVFDKDKIIHSFTLASDINKLSDEYGIIILNLLKNAEFNNKIKCAIVSSVVAQLDDIIKEALIKYLNIEVHLINYKMKLPITLKTETPKELGADRIANASAAVKLYKLPVIAIDFGTATTFDIIDENKNFIGGLIAPGLLIQAKSLSSFTSKLPKIKIEAPKSVIATGTINAMMSGIVLGHASMIDGMIKKCETELKRPATIVATGGLSSVLFDCMERKFDYLDKDLTHKGIKILYDINFGDTK